MSKGWFGKITEDVALNPELSKNARLVYLVLAMYADKDTGVTLVGTERIAQQSGMSVRTAERALAELRDGGHIERTRRFNTSSKTTLIGVRDLPRRAS